MKAKLSHAIAVLLSMLMILSLVACGNSGTNTKNSESADKSGDTTTAEVATEEDVFDARKICEGVTLTVAVASDDLVIDWDTTLSTQMVEEALGVNLEFEVYASSDYDTKINVMVQGGDKLPDIILSTKASSGIKDYTSWAAADAIIPLNEYYEDENYAHYINLACDELGIDLGSYLKDADGKIWGTPKYNVTPPNEIIYKLVINEKYLDMLGLEKPVTTEDFYNVCKAFVEAGDLNGNGEDDEVPFAGYNNLRWFQFMMSSYAYAFDNYYMDVVDGELSFSFTSDEWKEGLKYIKRFFDDGIFNTTMLTQDDTSYRAIAKDNEAPHLCDLTYLAQMSDNTVRLEYGYVPALESPVKEAECFYQPILPYVGAVITADCENPDAAFLVLDYMCSEEVSITNRYGERGVDWDYWDEVDESKLPEGMTKADFTSYYPDLYEEPYIMMYGLINGAASAPQNAGYSQAGTLILPDKMYWGRALLANTDDVNLAANADVYIKYNTNYWIWREYIPDETIDYLPMTSDESDAISDIWSTLNSYITESIGAFLTGEWDIDSYWDTYLAEIEKIGAAELLETVQTVYDRTK